MENYKAATSHIKDVTIRRIKGTNHLMSISPEEKILDISKEYLNVLINWLMSKLKS